MIAGEAEGDLRGKKEACVITSGGGRRAESERERKR